MVLQSKMFPVQMPLIQTAARWTEMCSQHHSMHNSRDQELAHNGNHTSKYDMISLIYINNGDSY